MTSKSPKKVAAKTRTLVTRVEPYLIGQRAPRPPGKRAISDVPQATKRVQFKAKIARAGMSLLVNHCYMPDYSSSRQDVSATCKDTVPQPPQCCCLRVLHLGELQVCSFHCYNFMLLLSNYLSLHTYSTNQRASCIVYSTSIMELT